MGFESSLGSFKGFRNLTGILKEHNHSMVNWITADYQKLNPWYKDGLTKIHYMSEEIFSIRLPGNVYEKIVISWTILFAWKQVLGKTFYF